MLLTAAVLVLVIFYLLRSISRRRAVMKFLKDKGGLMAKAAPKAAAKKKKAKAKPKKRKPKRK
jgi:hypothetical protein